MEKKIFGISYECLEDTLITCFQHDELKTTQVPAIKYCCRHSENRTLMYFLRLAYSRRSPLQAQRPVGRGFCDVIEGPGPEVPFQFGSSHGKTSCPSFSSRLQCTTLALCLWGAPPYEYNISLVCGSTDRPVCSVAHAYEKGRELLACEEE